MSIMHDVMYPPDRREYSKQAPLHKKSNHITEPGEVFYCKQCNRCYQDPVAKNLKNKDTVEYLQDFPTIDKERKVCYECTNLRVICDLCDRDVPKEVGDLTEDIAVMVPNITKRNGIWICKPCDKKYPEEDNNDK